MVTMEHKKCPTCGVREHVPMTEREVDNVRYCVIYIRKWTCLSCLEVNLPETEWLKEEIV